MTRTSCKLTQLLLPTLFLILSTPLAASAASGTSCVERVKSKCLECHHETRICQKINKDKGKGSWKRTLKSMIRNGAKVSKADQKLLVDCLRTPDAEIRELCPAK